MAEPIWLSKSKQSATSCARVKQEGCVSVFNFPLRGTDKNCKTHSIVHFLERCTVLRQFICVAVCSADDIWRHQHRASLRHHCLSLSPSLADLACKPFKAATLNHWGGHTVSNRLNLKWMYQSHQIRRPESAWYGNILCRIQTMSGNPNPNPESKIQNPNDAVWGRRKKNED